MIGRDVMVAAAAALALAGAFVGAWSLESSEHGTTLRTSVDTRGFSTAFSYRYTPGSTIPLMESKPRYDVSFQFGLPNLPEGLSYGGWMINQTGPVWLGWFQPSQSTYELTWSSDKDVDDKFDVVVVMDSSNTRPSEFSGAAFRAAHASYTKGDQPRTLRATGTIGPDVDPPKSIEVRLSEGPTLRGPLTLPAWSGVDYMIWLQKGDSGLHVATLDLPGGSGSIRSAHPVTFELDSRLPGNWRDYELVFTLVPASVTDAHQVVYGYPLFQAFD